jgi:LysR family cyn operon transcriptional activator
MLLRHIRYLNAVAEFGSFTRAAQALHVSQPALSQQIRELEERLGAQLLDRSGRQIRPTDMGRAYLERARRALSELEEGARAIRDVEDLSTGSLRLGVTPSVAAYLIAPLSQRFWARYPGITLSISVSAQEEMEPALMQDALDLGIGFGDLPSDDIEATPLHVERVGLIVSAKRPRTRKILSAAEVAAMPLALLDSSFSTRRIVDRFFREQGLRPHIAVESNSLLALMELIRLSDLATILPENVSGAGLVTVKTDPVFEPRRAALLRRRNAYCSAAARAFIATTQQVVAKFV